MQWNKISRFNFGVCLHRPEWSFLLYWKTNCYTTEKQLYFKISIIKTLGSCVRPWALYMFCAPGVRHQGVMVRDISLVTTLPTEGTAHSLQIHRDKLFSLPDHFSFVTLSFVCSLSGCPRARKSGIKIIHSKENKEDQEPIRYSAGTDHKFFVRPLNPEAGTSSCHQRCSPSTACDIWLFISCFKTDSMWFIISPTKSCAVHAYPPFRPHTSP